VVSIHELPRRGLLGNSDGMHPHRSESYRAPTYLGDMLPITICEEGESTKEKVGVGRKRDDEGLQDWEKDRDQKRQDEHDEREEIRQEEHDERAQVRR
jgi:hypothetical protein